MATCGGDSSLSDREVTPPRPGEKRPAEKVTSTDTSRSHKKKRPSCQSFKPCYSQEWPCFVQSRVSPCHAFCKICMTDFSIKHGGRDDCRRHSESAKHKSYGQAQEKNKSIVSFFGQQDQHSTKVTQAEATMAGLIADLNLPLSAADTFTKAFKSMFSDSKIAGDFQCGRSKATAVVKELASQQKSTLRDRMRNTPFTISTDGSNDTGSKQFPLVVRTFNSDTLEVRSEVLAIPTLDESATGENIAKLIKDEFAACGLPWDKCLALGADNANVMTGTTKGVYAFLKKKQPSLFMAGCVCHLIHICAEKAAACLPIKIDELLIDIYYYLDKSSVRQKAFKDMQLKHDIKNSKLLKHVSTRWLSVGKCLPHLLTNWRALKEFITEEKKARKGISSTNMERLERLSTQLSSPTNRLYCIFLEDVLRVFDKVNTILQCEEPKIHTLRKIIRKLFRDLGLRFLKPVAMHGILINNIQYDQAYHHKADRDIIIGDKATDFIKIAKEHHLREERQKEFFINVKKFFVEACSYLKKLPLDDELLGHAEIADPAEQLSCKQSSVDYFLEHFPAMLPNDCSRQTLLEEFSLYQCTLLDKQEEHEPVDVFWGKVSVMKDPNGAVLFPFLPTFMASILTIPHSSAHCERVFSCVRKNKTDQRASLGQETLEALMVVKSQPGGTLNRHLKKEDLVAIKKCYSQSLKK